MHFENLILPITPPQVPCHPGLTRALLRQLVKKKKKTYSNVCLQVAVASVQGDLNCGHMSRSTPDCSSLFTLLRSLEWVACRCAQLTSSFLSALVSPIFGRSHHYVGKVHYYYSDQHHVHGHKIIIVFIRD